MNTNTAPAVECPTCHAEAGARCQSIYAVWNGAEYVKNPAPAATHAKRKRLAAQAA